MKKFLLHFMASAFLVLYFYNEQVKCRNIYPKDIYPDIYNLSGPQSLVCRRVLYLEFPPYVFLILFFASVAIFFIKLPER